MSPATSGSPRAVLVRDISSVRFRNNILVTTGDVPLVNAYNNSELLFQGNNYWTSGSTFTIFLNGMTLNSLNAWRSQGQERLNGQNTGFAVDPKLENPGVGGTVGDADRLHELNAYKLQDGSPMIDAALNLQSLFGINPGITDFYGTGLPQGAGYDIGAHERSSSSTVSNGIYKLTARHSGKALEASGGPSATGNGVAVNQWEYLGQTNQQWEITHLGDGYYKLIARHSGKALDVSGISTANGAYVHQWEYVNGANQQWKIEPVGEGYYKLTARHSNKALDVSGGPSSTGNGVIVHQWEYLGQANQQWRLEQIP